jgi:hypothetical protein
MPFRWPRPDPVQRSPDEGYRMNQPYIHRLTHLGAAAVERGRGLAFLDEVSRTIWGGTLDNWHEGDHLAHAAERAGLDLAEMAAAVRFSSARTGSISSNGGWSRRGSRRANR